MSFYDLGVDQNVYRDQAGADASDDPEGGLTRGGRRLVLNCALTPHEMRVVAERWIAGIIARFQDTGMQCISEAAKLQDYPKTSQLFQTRY